MDNQTFLFELAMAGMIALAPAHVAHNKGRSFVVWWFFGLLLWIVAYPASLLIKPRMTTLEIVRAGKQLPSGTVIDV